MLEAKADQERLEALLEEDRRVIKAAQKQRARHRLQARRAERALREAKQVLRARRR